MLVTKSTLINGLFIKPQLLKGRADLHERAGFGDLTCTHKESVRDKLAVNLISSFTRIKVAGRVETKTLQNFVAGIVRTFVWDL